jgi:(1->4)-alpha-D-glucan 1-alpha-D-glucosylmutase
MLKAGREAKVHSSWVNPNTDYEEATRDFVRTLLSPDPGNLFLREFLPLQQRLARVGAINSLAQVLLKLTSPGVPDIYQGSELWDFSLVDPDNRRPVDYAPRREALQAITTAHAERGAAVCARELLDRLEDGRIKLYLTWKTLGFRRERETLFRDGAYLPLKSHGTHAEQACVFARQADGETVLVVAPRLVGRLMGEEGRLPIGEAVWADTWVELPPEWTQGSWHNVLTGQAIAVGAQSEGQGLALAQVFGTFPYALLRADDAAP